MTMTPRLRKVALTAHVASSVGWLGALAGFLTLSVHLSFPALLDLDGEVSSRYRVHAIPTTVLIDRNGRIVGTAIGPRDLASPDGKALIRSLLGQRTGIDSGPAAVEAPAAGE